MTSRYHAGSGLCFTRLPDGSVLVEVFEDERLDKRIRSSQVLQPGAWASVMASVSARGENPATHAEAVERHQLQYELVLAPSREDEVTEPAVKRPGWRHD